MPPTRPATLGTVSGLSPLRRPRLDAPFTAALQSEVATCVLVVAPAGWGKSVAVAQWISSLDLAPDRFWWRTCTEITRPEALKADLEEAALAHDILVVDDFHLVSSDDFDLEFARWLQERPDTTVVLIARVVHLLGGPLLKLSLAREYVGVPELRLNREEARALALQRKLEPAPSREDALALADGHPSTIDSLLMPGQGSPDRAMAALARQVLASAPEGAAGGLSAVAALGTIGEETLLNLLGACAETATATLRACIDLGLLVPAGRATLIAPLNAFERTDPGDRGEHSRPLEAEMYAVPPLLQSELARHFEQSYTSAQQHRLRVKWAHDLANHDPVAALCTLIATRAFTEAELLALRQFGALIETRPRSLPVAQQIPAEVLRVHPGLASLRLALESSGTAFPAESFCHYFAMIAGGARRRLACDTTIPAALIGAPSELDTQTEPDSPQPAPGSADYEELRTNAIVQLMTAERFCGSIETAVSLAELLELEFSLRSSGSPATQTRSRAAPHAAPANFHLHEIGTVGLVAMRPALARRAFTRMLESVTSPTTSSGLAKGGARHGEYDTLPHPEPDSLRHDEGWLNIALAGLALAEVLDGRMIAAESLITRWLASRDAAQSDPADLDSVNASIARAFVAIAHFRVDEAEAALRAIESHRECAEKWPVVTVARAEVARIRRGTEWAVTIAESAPATAVPRSHQRRLSAPMLAPYAIMLHTITGNFRNARGRLRACPTNNTALAVERARLALCAGDPVAALLEAQRTSGSHRTVREQFDLHLISAIAAAQCGSEAEAIHTLGQAAEMLSEYGLCSRLRHVPYEPLHALNQRAIVLGAASLPLAELERIPAHLRCAHFERLTPMEQRVLEAIASDAQVVTVAEILYLTPGTVKNHLRAVYRKLRVANREHAVLRATRMGLLPKRLGPVEPPRPSASPALSPEDTHVLAR